MSPRLNKSSLLRHCSALAALILAAGRAAANPAGMTVAAGTVTAAQTGSQLNITASQNAVINWQSFNIAAGETTTFQQPNQISVVWNRIADANPSQIWGRLNANGIVVLMNQNGFYFGPNSCVNVGGFVAAGAWVTPPASAGGAMWTYQGPPPSASIINYGEIKANNGGSLFLVAEKIENHGMLTAPDGTLGLYAGKQVLLSERPDGRGLSANVALPSGSIDNFGKISADAGSIALHAQVVNQNGIIQANAVCDNNGVIELIASDAVNLGATSLIQANGDDSGASGGGQITIKSANTFADDPASRLEVRGGANGGNGGAVEVSAVNIATLDSRMDAGAQAGWQAGGLLLDPYNIILGNTGAGSAGTGIILAPGGGNLALNVRTAFLNKNFSHITLQAQHDISLLAGTLFNLNVYTGVSTPGSRLTLEAGNNITFGNNASITAGAGWSVSLAAGVDFSSPTLATQPGIGGIYGCSIQTSSGDLTLNAGHEVLVGNGYLRTVGGGNISVTTGDGDVDAGTRATTFNAFDGNGYTVSSALGGIATKAGGNVTITAGNDIGTFNTAASIGAFGAGGQDVNTGALLGDAAPGNVTLIAGHDIVGSFMLVNGAGKALAGHNVGADFSSATFGLVKGGWTIKAGWDQTSSSVVSGQGDIILNEVYNPNGSLNDANAAYGAGVTHQFDYAADAYVNLESGHAVLLVGDNVAGATYGLSTPIYAPVLTIKTGAGGVTLDRGLILFPSPQGSLNIVTAGGGGVQSAGVNPSGQANVLSLTISDAESFDATQFSTGHAALPLHLGQIAPVLTLDISGDLHNVALVSAGRAEITVGGSAVNFSFEGRNLALGDKTKINIIGDYINRGDPTSIIYGPALSDAPGADLFNQIFSDPVFSLIGNPDSPYHHLLGRVFYNAATRQLGYLGTLSAADLNLILNPMVYWWDPTVGYHYDSFGEKIIVPATFTTDAAALTALAAATQDIPAQTGSLKVRGPGQLLITARNMDLGTSVDGISSMATTVSPLSADIKVTLTGDLKMTSSTIATYGGGSIDVESAGKMDLGSPTYALGDTTPKGIYTGHGGAVTVHAGGDINVDGSRIATYDGGAVTVISDNGLVDAGAGAGGFFRINTSVYDPVTMQLVTSNDKFFGSGILALTSPYNPDSTTLVGNVSVTAHGDILAGTGGILQLAFNHADQSGAQLSLHSLHGSIHAGQSGVLGKNVTAQADDGSVDGIFVASGNADIHASQNVSVTALAGGNASVGGGGTVSGTIVGGGNVSVAGSEVTAAAISTGGSVSGGTSGATTAFAGVAAPTAQKTTESADKTVASATTTDDEEEQKKKRGEGRGAVLAQKTSRVTVILPKKI